jgi:putative salt-induced outer membrane protein
MGITAFKTARGKIDLEGGPALRQTDFIGQPARTTVAGRASLAARYALTPTLSFSEDASIFIEKTGDTTASATSAIDTRLIGRLKAKLSYNIQYEQDQTQGHNSLDTVGRASLVYAF